MVSISLHDDCPPKPLRSTSPAPSEICISTTRLITYGDISCNAFAVSKRNELPVEISIAVSFLSFRAMMKTQFKTYLQFTLLKVVFT